MELEVDDHESQAFSLATGLRSNFSTQPLQTVAGSDEGWNSWTPAIHKVDMACVCGSWFLPLQKQLQTTVE